MAGAGRAEVRRLATAEPTAVVEVRRAEVRRLAGLGVRRRMIAASVMAISGGVEEGGDSAMGRAAEGGGGGRDSGRAEAGGGSIGATVAAEAAVSAVIGIGEEALGAVYRSRDDNESNGAATVSVGTKVREGGNSV